MHNRQPAPMVESLTPREQDILTLIAEGLTNAEICQRLHLVLSTVKTYNTQIFGKLSVKNRREAVVRGRILGLVDVGVLDLPKNNLPAQTTPFIGRETELTELAQLLADPDLRLITVLAPGGMGKTRLALELAERIVESPQRKYPNGVFFVSLAPIRDPAHIVSAIAEAAGFQFMQDQRDPKQQVLDFLSNKQMLLILDNFEHLLEGAGIVTDILESAPGVTVLATSRERLNLRSETVFSITGMDCGESIETCDALALFEQSARQVRADFVLSEDNHEAVTSICDLVEGMPLAIILAAAWVEVLSLEEIAEEITQSVDFLTAEMRDVPRRQWSIRAVFEPTWTRLTDSECDAFMRFSVFRGGATRSAAQTITGADLRTLQSLVNKALIWRGPGGRYEIHELFRQFAESKLEEAGEVEPARDAHSEYYLNALAKRETDLKGRDQLNTLNDIESDFENIKAAWGWAAEARNYDSINGALDCLTRFLDWRRPVHDGIALFGEAREAMTPQVDEEPHPIWSKLVARWHPDDLIYGKDHTQRYEQCLEIARKYDDRKEIAYLLKGLSFAAGRHQGDRNQERALLEESLSLLRGLDDKYGIARTIHSIAIWHILVEEDREKFLELVYQSLDLAREIGHRVLEADNLFLLAYNASYDTTDNAASEKYLREAYAIQREVGNLFGSAHSVRELSGLAFNRGDFEQSRKLAEEALENLAYTRGDWGRQRWGFITAPLELIAENYEKARQLCQNARPHHVTNVAGIDSLLSLAFCGLQDYDAAWQSIQSALTPATNWGIVKMTDCLLVASCSQAHEGDPVYAVELLGLVFTHPQAATGWMEKWPLLIRLRADLKLELGEAVYNAAWERGRQLDLETVVRELLDDYEQADLDD